MKKSSRLLLTGSTQSAKILFAYSILTSLSGQSVEASSYTWNQTGATNNWGTIGNWSTTTPPAGGPNASGDVDTINTNITANATVNLFNTGDSGTAAKTVGTLNIGDLTGVSNSFIIAAGTGGGSLVLNNNGAGAQINELAGSKGDTISAGVQISDAGGLTVANTSANTFLMSGGVTSSGTGDLILNANSTGGITLSTVSVNHSGMIVNSGGGTGLTTISSAVGSNVTGITENSAGGSGLTLSGANTAYAGTTTLTAGTLNLNSTSALGTGSMVINGGILDNTTAATIGLLSATTYTATTVTSGSLTIALSNTSNLAVGQFVFGTSVGSGAYITAINPGVSISLSTANSGTSSNVVLTFGALNTQTWGGDFTYTGTKSLNLGSGAVSLGSGVGTARTITVNANTLTDGGIISNGTTVNSLIKAGAGALTLTGANTFTGSVTVTGGTLTLSNANAFTGSVLVNGGTLSLNGANVYSGTTTIQNGNLNVGNANALGTGNTTDILLGDTAGTNTAKLSVALTSGGALARNVIVEAGSGIDILGENVASVTDTFSGTITLGSSGTSHGLTLSNSSFSTLIVSGKISDPSSFSGTAGLLTIAGNNAITSSAGVVSITNTGNNYTGGTLLSSGRLGMGLNASLGSGTFVINVGAITGGTNGGGFTQNSNGSLGSNNAMVWDSDFITDITGTPGNISLNLGTGAVSLGDGNQVAGSTRTLYVNSSTVTVNGAISDSTSGSTVNNLTKAGAGTLQLGGASNYSGTTTISSGKVQLTTGNDRLPTGTVVTLSAGSTSTAAGGMLDLNTRSQTITGLAGGSGTGFQSIITNGGASTTSLLTVNNTSNYEYDGILAAGGTGALALLKSGTGALTLTGSNNYTGGTTINAGTLDVTGSLSSVSAATMTGTGSIAGNIITVTSATGLNVGQTVTGTGIPTGSVVTGINGSIVTISNYMTANLSGSNNVSFGAYNGSGLGSGATSVTGGILNGSGTISGAVSVSGTGGVGSGGTVSGSLHTGALTVQSGGVVSPGNGLGVLTASSAAFQSAGDYILQMNSDGGSGAAGTNWDQLALSGSLDVSALSSANPFTLTLQTLTASNVAGDLASFDPSMNHMWSSVITTAGLTLSFNPNLFAVDTSSFQNGLSGVFSLVADGNNFDLVYTAAVPEPGTWAMMLGGLASLIAVQRRRSKND